MKVCVAGLSYVSDKLRLDTLERFKWEEVADVLSIPGVAYYYVEAGTMGVRYRKGADPKDVAAQTLRLLADVSGVAPQDLIVIVDDLFLGNTESLEIADEIRRRACVTDPPQSVPVHRVQARGTRPAYWLAS